MKILCFALKLPLLLLHVILFIWKEGKVSSFSQGTKNDIQAQFLKQNKGFHCPPSSLFHHNTSGRNIFILQKSRIFASSSHLEKRAYEEQIDETSDSKESDKAKKYPIKTIEALNKYFNDTKRRFRKKNVNEIDYDKLLKDLYVEGDTQILGSTSPDKLNFIHPLVKLLHDRRKNESPLTPSGKTRPDGKKVALVVEGGGMRGCVTAGMVAAIHYLGLEDAFDVIYGSSAGTVIGAYFNTRQLPWFGPEIYYDSLTTAGTKFIDPKRLLRSLGLGLIDPRLLKDVLTRPRFGKPVINLEFLLKTTMQEKKKLDWQKFEQMQKVQPLKVVASGLKCGDSVVFDMAHGGFTDIQELAGSMQGSCLLPGIAGPIVNYDKHLSAPEGKGRKFFIKNNCDRHGIEPLGDAMIFEPLPYRTAIREGATDVVVLRSKPDGIDVTGKTSIFEKLIYKRYFRRKNPHLRHIYKYMRQHGHKKKYAEEVIELNEATNMQGDKSMIAIALPPGSPGVGRLEARRSEIFAGVRRGFARAYDALVEDPNERGRGVIVAKQVLPDEILDYDPLQVDGSITSAFQLYLDEKDIAGEEYSLDASVGKTAKEAGLPY